MSPRLVTAALAAALLVPGTAQAAKAKPDLSISKAAATGTQSLSVSWTVKNAGKAAAPKSSTGLVLSTDAKLDKADVRLGAFAQKAVKARKTATGTGTAKLPGGLAARTYTLLVCADVAGKVKESSETNNCRTASSIDVSG